MKSVPACPLEVSQSRQNRKMHVVQGRRGPPRTRSLASSLWKTSGVFRTANQWVTSGRLGEMLGLQLLLIVVLIIKAAYPYAKVESIRALVSGNESGYLAPCGCSWPQLGGIGRRAEVIARSNKEWSPVLSLSNGDLVNGFRRQDEIKFQILMEAMKVMGYVAHNVGANDLALGLETLKAFPSEEGYPTLISANVFDRQGQSLFEPYVMLGKEKRVAIVGIMCARFAQELRHLGSGFVLKSPEEVLHEVLREIRSRELKTRPRMTARNTPSHTIRFDGASMIGIPNVCNATLRALSSRRGS